MRQTNKLIVASLTAVLLACSPQARSQSYTDRDFDNPGDSMPPEIVDDQFNSAPPPAPQPQVMRQQSPIIAPAPPPGAIPNDEDEADYFYDDLAPYGQWISVDDYGMCWRPTRVTVGWQPYVMGHWAYTDDCGWLWASDEPFGWATYHYGRWTRHPYYGWCWVPGRVWGPSWVTWRHGNGYTGWAPLPPARRGITISAQIGTLDSFCFNFVQERYVCEPRIRDHCEPVTRNVTIINQTRNITRIQRVNNVIVNRGIDVQEVERVQGKPVKHLKVVDSGDKKDAQQVRGDQVAVYRPKLPDRKPQQHDDRNANDARQAADRTPPSRFERDDQRNDDKDVQRQRDNYFQQLRQDMDQRHQKELQQQADDRQRQQIQQQHEREQKTLDEQRQRANQPNNPPPNVVRRRPQQQQPEVQPAPQQQQQRNPTPQRGSARDGNDGRGRGNDNNNDDGNGRGRGRGNDDQ